MTTLDWLSFKQPPNVPLRLPPRGQNENLRMRELAAPCETAAKFRRQNELSTSAGPEANFLLDDVEFGILCERS
jgi:hypothetical protein